MNLAELLKIFLYENGSALPFEILDCTFLLLRCFACLEGTQIATLAGLRVFLVGVQAVFPRFQFSDHGPNSP